MPQNKEHHQCLCVRVCVSIYWLERDLGRVIPEVRASWILSATTVQLEVTPGHGDTPGHDSVKQSHPEQKMCL